MRNFSHPLYTMALAAVLGTALVGCKSMSSKAKSADELADVGSMSEADFVAACEKRLNDPKEGALTKQMLQQYTQTTDCRTAYPKVQALVAAKQQSPGK